MTKINNLRNRTRSCTGHPFSIPISTEARLTSTTKADVAGTAEVCLALREGREELVGKRTSQLLFGAVYTYRISRAMTRSLMRLLLIRSAARNYQHGRRFYVLFLRHPLLYLPFETFLPSIVDKHCLLVLTRMHRVKDEHTQGRARTPRGTRIREIGIIA